LQQKKFLQKIEEKKTLGSLKKFSQKFEGNKNCHSCKNLEEGF
jgi:hypothetical protein